ncbi:MAG: hypothetical protein Q8K99_05660 [Actinomycetota bacterium]|nr:hypothetical protein [Actinomycetota bacterium]
MRLLRCGAMLLIVACLCVSVGGCASGEQAAESSESVKPKASSDEPVQVEEEPVETTPEPEPEPDPIKLTGKGTKVTKKFALADGLAVFSMSHKGSSNFIVHLRSVDGEVDEGLVNEIGKFNGSWPIFLGAGDYLLEVEADGPWAFTITQPRPASVDVMTQFKGKGKTATDIFYLDAGMKTVVLKHTGESNFIVHVHGVADEGLVNEIGKFDGSVILDVPESGGAIFSVEADGDWSIKIE